MRQSLILSAALAGLIATPALAADPAKVAEAVADTAARSEANVAMDANRHPVEMLQFIGLEEGMRVLDLVGGNLYWSEIMAPAVGPYGQVVIWSPTEFYSDKAKAAGAAFAERHSNVVRLNSQFETPMVGKAMYDFVILNLDYHDTYWESERFGITRMEPRHWAKAIYDAMKPGAVLGVADHRAAAGTEPRAGVEAAHRIDPAVVRADMEAVGFVFEAESDLLANPDDDLTTNVFDPSIRGKTSRFLMKFRKPE